MAKKRSRKAKAPKPNGVRNIHACNPIMRKGGVHEKSNSAKRSKGKRSTEKQVRQWRSDAPSHFLKAS